MKVFLTAVWLALSFSFAAEAAPVHLLCDSVGVPTRFLFSFVRAELSYDSKLPAQADLIFEFRAPGKSALLTGQAYVDKSKENPDTLVTSLTVFDPRFSRVDFSFDTPPGNGALGTLWPKKGTQPVGGGLLRCRATN